LILLPLVGSGNRAHEHDAHGYVRLFALVTSRSPR